MSKVVNWKFSKDLCKVAIVEGGEVKLLDNVIEQVIENGKVVKVRVKCPFCSFVHEYATPYAPAPTLSEIVAITTAYAYYWAVRILLGKQPNWNVMYIFPDYVETARVAITDDHKDFHMSRFLFK